MLTNEFDKYKFIPLDMNSVEQLERYVYAFVIFLTDKRISNFDRTLARLLSVISLFLHFNLLPPQTKTLLKISKITNCTKTEVISEKGALSAVVPLSTE